MTTFWKPRGRGRIGTAIPAYQKRLGHALYELWFRCDLCFKSDPMSAAYRWHKVDLDIHLCAACDVQFQGYDVSARDGWQRVP